MNITYATLTQDFHNLTDFQIVTPHAAHVLDMALWWAASS